MPLAAGTLIQDAALVHAVQLQPRGAVAGYRLIPPSAPSVSGGRPERSRGRGGTLVDFESLIADGDGALPGETVGLAQHAKIEADRCRARLR